MAERIELVFVCFDISCTVMFCSKLWTFKISQRQSIVESVVNLVNQRWTLSVINWRLLSVELNWQHSETGDRVRLTDYRRLFVTLSIHLCVEAARRAGTSATADSCFRLSPRNILHRNFMECISRKCPDHVRATLLGRVLAMGRCLSVSVSVTLSQVGVVSKRMDGVCLVGLIHKR